jgi:hypothetical protein
MSSDFAKKLAEKIKAEKAEETEKQSQAASERNIIATEGRPFFDELLKWLRLTIEEINKETGDDTFEYLPSGTNSFSIVSHGLLLGNNVSVEFVQGSTSISVSLRQQRTSSYSTRFLPFVSSGKLLYRQDGSQARADVAFDVEKIGEFVMNWAALQNRP